ncbi:MAG: YtxH domain-containing protein [Gemmatimonadales bacterium]
MTDDTREGGSALPWFLLGIGLGAGLGLLLAPQAGRETRAALKKRVRALRDLATEQFEDARDVLSDRFDAVAEAVTGDDEDDEEQDAVPARAEVERRLAAVRARRRGGVGARSKSADEEPTA